MRAIAINLRTKRTVFSLKYYIVFPMPLCRTNTPV